MDPVKVSATELRVKTRDLMERVKFRGEHLIVENFGRPMAVVISYEDYMRVKDMLADHKRQPRSESKIGEAK